KAITSVSLGVAASAAVPWQTSRAAVAVAQSRRRVMGRDGYFKMNSFVKVLLIRSGVGAAGHRWVLNGQMAARMNHACAPFKPQPLCRPQKICIVRQRVGPSMRSYLG